jgi:hypothetical protein
MPMIGLSGHTSCEVSELSEEGNRRPVNDMVTIFHLGHAHVVLWMRELAPGHIMVSRTRVQTRELFYECLRQLALRTAIDQARRQRSRALH